MIQHELAITPNNNEFHNTYETQTSNDEQSINTHQSFASLSSLHLLNNTSLDGNGKPFLDLALGEFVEESFDDDEALLFNDTSSGYGYNQTGGGGSGSERDTNTVVTDGTLKQDIDLDLVDDQFESTQNPFGVDDSF